MGIKGCANRKSTYDVTFNIPVIRKFCSIFHRLAVICMSIDGPQLDLPFGDLQFVGYSRRETKVGPTEMSHVAPIFLFDFYIRDRVILHRLAQRTTLQTETHRVSGIF